MAKETPQETARQAAEGLREKLKALPDLAAFCEGLLLYAPVPYAVFGMEGHPVLVNPAYQAMFGAVPPPEYNLHEDPLLAEAGLDTYVRRAYQGETAEAPVIWYDPKQLPHLQLPESTRRAAIACTFFPLFDRQGRVSHLAVAYKDVTAVLEEREALLVLEVEARQRAEALAEELRRSVETRDTFLSVASHELKTPLTPLSLKLQTFSRAFERGLVAGELPRLRKDVEVMRRQVRRLTDLINDLLDVARLGSGQLRLEREPVELCALAREMAMRFEPEAVRAGCRLEVHAEGEVRGHWDKLRLEQVVANLLSNALKYGAGKPVRFHVEAAGPWACLVVQDEGIGIEPEALERIFQKFERAVSDRHYGGLGLGLYVTKQIVDALGGSVRVESAPGRGATFTVELPVKAPLSP
jgi:signal transduction histidine kinase